MFDEQLHYIIFFIMAIYGLFSYKKLVWSVSIMKSRQRKRLAQIYPKAFRIIQASIPQDGRMSAPAV